LTETFPYLYGFLRSFVPLPKQCDQDTSLPSPFFFLAENRQFLDRHIENRLTISTSGPPPIDFLVTLILLGAGDPRSGLSTGSFAPPGSVFGCPSPCYFILDFYPVFLSLRFQNPLFGGVGKPTLSVPGFFLNPLTWDQFRDNPDTVSGNFLNLCFKPGFWGFPGVEKTTSPFPPTSGIGLPRQNFVLLKTTAPCPLPQPRFFPFPAAPPVSGLRDVACLCSTRHTTSYPPSFFFETTYSQSRLPLSSCSHVPCSNHPPPPPLPQHTRKPAVDVVCHHHGLVRRNIHKSCLLLWTFFLFQRSG